MMNRAWSPRAGVALLTVVTLESAGCAPRAFNRDLRDQRWVDAARAFQSDSALMNDERALYDAGILYSSPNRPTYDPQRAEQVLRRLLDRFPETRFRGAALDRLAIVDALLRSSDSAKAHELAIEARIGALTADVQRLRSSLDSTQGQSELLRRNFAKIESDLHDRDEQLRALRLELKQLKDVDLNPRPSGARPP